nr:unnamed protein product [Callosobruchus analis]
MDWTGAVIIKIFYIMNSCLILSRMW